MRIVFIGAGAVATHLSQALAKAGHTIAQVFSRTNESALSLASKLGCSYTSDPKDIIADAELYIFSVNDSSLEALVQEIAPGRDKALFVHTAGSIPLTVFEGYATRYGVVYPMQTFSKEKDICMAQTPLFIEACNAEEEHTLKRWFENISSNVSVLSSEKRRRLHLAAVFACNFTNHCYAKAEQILGDIGIPFSVMLPLIDETAAKVHTLSPRGAQTGPAVRYDTNVMEEHCSLLSEEDAALYMKISKSINSI